MNRLTRKLETFTALSEDDKHFLDNLIGPAREVKSRTDIIREGDAPADVHLILDGFACRYKLTADGTRQIMAYLLPGDFCDLHVAILKEMDHSIATLSPCRVVDIPPARVEEMTQRPGLAQALRWTTLVDEATLREWLVNIGQRDAARSLAHLVCELFVRLKAVGLTVDHGFELPITQEELGDTLGLSTVHINRSLQVLRGNGAITLTGKHLVIVDPQGLVEFCGFNPNYLHHFNSGMNRRPA